MTELPIEVEGASEFTSHPTEDGRMSGIPGELMRRLQTLASENPGDPSLPERLPLVPEFSHLSEYQIDVADILRTAEQQAQTVREVTAACALATTNAHFLDPQLQALAETMRDDVLDKDGNPKTPLEALQAAMLKEREHLAEQYARLISDKRLLHPSLPTTINDKPDSWCLRTGRVDLAIVLQKLLNTDPSDPEYPQIARMYFALQQGVEDITVVDVYSALTSRGRTIEELNIQSGIARLPKGWRIEPFHQVGDNEILPYNPDTFTTTPFPLFGKVVMIPHALGGENGKTGIPKLPSVSGKMNIPQ